MSKRVASPDSTLEVALSLARHGWPVFPVIVRERPDGKRDKIPAIKGWTTGAASTDAEQIATWWGSDFTGAWIGVWAQGAGIVVVDIDRDKGSGSGKANLKAAGVELPKTLTYKTPSGGRHLVYRAPADRALTIAQGVPVPAVDIRAGNGQMVYYGPALDDAPVLADAPEWACVAARAKSSGSGNDVDVEAWLRKLRGGKPSKTVKRARRVVSNELKHDAMLAAVNELVKLGASGEHGVRKAVIAARAEYVLGRPDREREWDNALAGSASHHGVPRGATFKRPKLPKVKMSEGAAVLDDVRAQLERFVVFPHDHALVATTLWAAHTHLIEHFDSSPRLAVLSTDAASGKTRTLEVLSCLAHDPVDTVNTSASYLARRIDGSTPPPTVLFDEVDTVYGPKSNGTAGEELRGILNSGHRRSGRFSRAAVRGKEVVLEEFKTFAPVALAGLGDLPDTVMTRSVVIKMRRRATRETVEPYRERDNGGELRLTGNRVAAWAKTAGKTIGNPWPVMPDGIVDRDADVWEPLIAVADAAGGHWPQMAREAAFAMVTDARNRPASLGIRLLTDVRRVLGGRSRIRSTELLLGLLALDDAPWEDLGGRGPIDSKFIGRTFKDYNIVAAHSIRFDATATGGHKGWDARDFVDAFDRYLPATKNASGTVLDDPSEN
jgi:hypothetical protein